MAARHCFEQEALFIVNHSTSLTIPAGDQLQTLSDHFSHQIARRPHDLKSHIHRIHLYIDARCSDGISGALQDLFIALGENGRELRERMLAHCYFFLDQECLEIFNHCLAEGMSDSSPRKLSNLSILHKGVDAPLVSHDRQSCRRYGPEDALDMALELLRNGEFQHAIHRLIEAIKSEPWRQDLHITLLDVYRHHGDAETFIPTYLFLSASNNPYIEHWEPLVEHFERGISQ